MFEITIAQVGFDVADRINLAVAKGAGESGVGSSEGEKEEGEEGMFVVAALRSYLFENVGILKGKEIAQETGDEGGFVSFNFPPGPPVASAAVPALPVVQLYRFKHGREWFVSTEEKYGAGLVVIDGKWK